MSSKASSLPRGTSKGNLKASPTKKAADGEDLSKQNKTPGIHWLPHPDLYAPIDNTPSKVPFTLKDIRDAIPAEKFDAVLWKSWGYIVKDLVTFAITAAITWYILEQIPSEFYWTRFAVWCMYGFVQGTTGFGLWVIGHECGHQAFFGRRRELNTWVGYAIHEMMLVPFHAWRITHAQHHHFTNHRDKDTAFPERDQPSWYWGAVQIFPPLVWSQVFGYCALGWPAYLTLNLEGQPFPEEVGRVNHYEPSSPYFKQSDYGDIVAQNIGLAVVSALYGTWAYNYGVDQFLLWYGLAWAGTHAWLVIITLLQHTDRRIPHYNDEDWTFVKGALATVDRTYGWPLDSMMHHITDAHLTHHVFSTMPFYHAKEVTPIVKKLLGEFYVEDKRWLPVQIHDAFFAHMSSFIGTPRYEEWQKKNGKKSA